MFWSYIIGFVCYTLTALMGVLAARRGHRFGIWHHVMYFASCASALAALLLHPTWLFVPLVVVLGAMPRTRAGSRWHAILGTVGWLSWMVVLANSFHVVP